MSWTLAPSKTKSARHISGAIEKSILDLIEGEIFSINPKARRFILSKIDVKKEPVGEITASELINGKPGTQFALPYADFEGRSVFVWGAVDEEEPNFDKAYKEFDRIKLKGTGVEGTVLDLNESKYPDVDIIALWDEIVHGKWITEVHPHEIEHLGVRASGKSLEMAQEAKPMLRERQEAEKHERKDQTKETVREEIQQQASRREEFKKKIDQEMQRDALAIARKTVNANTEEFNQIVQAGVLTVTAGGNNYEIDLIPSIVDGHLEHIANKVLEFTTDPELRVVATIELLKILSDLMIDQYMLTREGYLRETDGNWGVYSKKGNKIGRHATKKKALRQLRAIEWRKRQGMAEEA